jgi:hypothetical protein
MNITRQQPGHDLKVWRGWHILTVAEAGFSMLDLYGRDLHKLEIEIIGEFAERVNRTDESGSLHPVAPISALPRRLFRDGVAETGGAPTAPAEFKREIVGFLAANDSTIRATRVLMDFHVSSEPVPKEYLQAAEEAILAAPAAGRVLREVVLLE